MPIAGVSTGIVLGILAGVLVKTGKDRLIDQLKLVEFESQQ